MEQEKTFKNIDKGALLIADPFLQDPFFYRSVIMLVEHGGTGSQGFILNKPLKTKLSDVLPEFVDKDFQIFYGGPVSTNCLYFIHTLGNLLEGSLPIGNGFYWGGNFEMLKKYMDAGLADEKSIKFFMGYTGWRNGQLKEELDAKSWLILNQNAQREQKNTVLKLFRTKSSLALWEENISKMGADFAFWAKFPENPSLN